MNELTREITGDCHAEVKLLFLLNLIYQVLFIWFVYIPVMWSLIPAYKEKIRIAGFMISILILLLNGIAY